MLRSSTFSLWLDQQQKLLALRSYLQQRESNIQISILSPSFTYCPPLTNSSMILELAHKDTYNKRNWKSDLRKSIYMKNREDFARKKIERGTMQVERTDQADRQRKYEQGLQVKLRKYKASKIFKNHGECFKLKDVMRRNDDHHGYYSFFIPLNIHTKFQDNQLTLTFPYVRRVQETKNSLEDCQSILNQFTETMTASKQNKKVDLGWFRCLKKYIAGIDSIRAIEIYLQLKKKGKITNPSRTLWLKYGGGSTLQIFIEKVQYSSEMIRSKNMLMKQWSVHSEQGINEVSMAKTMKQLFCSICFLYDCAHHSWDSSVKEREFHYIAPTKAISERQRLKDAISLCLAYQQIAKPLSNRSKQSCCSSCYKLLEGASWERLQKQVGIVLSPIVKGIVKLGIEMFSYSPCRIWRLVKDRNITCSHIFLSLIEDYNLISKIEQKLMNSQMKRLLHQSKSFQEDPPTQPRTQSKRGKDKQRQTLPECSISCCIHYFIGQQPVDAGCQNCSCRIRNFCVPECLCKEECPIRKRGCSCKKEECRTTACVCFRNNQECDPYLCKGCFMGSSACKNHQILSRAFKKVAGGRSLIQEAGVGLFAKEEVKKGELVMIYAGEIIDSEVQTLRETLRLNDTFYNFGSIEGTVDGRFMGNLSRFINHADQQEDNLQAKTVLTGGRYNIAFFARKDIEKGEELFFDYDGNGELYRNHKNKYPFIRKKK